jgi:hypothetical protein
VQHCPDSLGIQVAARTPLLRCFAAGIAVCLLFLASISTRVGCGHCAVICNSQHTGACCLSAPDAQRVQHYGIASVRFVLHSSASCTPSMWMELATHSLNHNAWQRTPQACTTCSAQVSYSSCHPLAGLAVRLLIVGCLPLAAHRLPAPRCPSAACPSLPIGCLPLAAHRLPAPR